MRLALAGLFLISGLLTTEQQPEFFTDVTSTAGIVAVHRAVWDEEGGIGYLGVGQAWGDYNNDGWLDLYLTGNRAPSVLYQNNQNGTFSVSPLSETVSLPDVRTGGATWADYDNDGWRDLLVVTQGADVLFHNEAGQGFIDVTDRAGVGDPGKGASAAWGDYDEDGFLDLYVVNWTCVPDCERISFPLHQDHLYRNNGNGTFTDVSHLLVYRKLLGAGFAASFTDYDKDGDLDLYVINDEYQNPIGNVLWRNEGVGCKGWCWADVSAVSGADIVLSGMGIAIGDYDNDLDQDFYVSNMINSFALLQNNGNGAFVDRAKNAGVHLGWTDAVGWGTAFFDYDNDGWQDLFLTATGFIQRELYMRPEGMHFPHVSYLFHNNSDGTFTNLWTGSKKTSIGVAFADYDKDGWVDFVVTNWNEGFQLFRNRGAEFSDHNWLTIELQGEGSIDRDAVGTKVYVTTDDGLTQFQEIINGSALGAGNDTALHFGLRKAQVESLRVEWLNGESQTFTNISVNQYLEIHFSDEYLTEGVTNNG